eukprot:gene10343-2757_t
MNISSRTLKKKTVPLQFVITQQQETHSPPNQIENSTAQRIGESTGLINRVYQNVGISFKSYFTFYPCRGSDGRSDYSTFDPNKVVSAVLKEKGSNFRSAGAFILIVGVPSETRLSGFMFPFNSNSGIGFMNKDVVNGRSPTLPHQLGHGLGLFHTFRGISEVRQYSQCYESTPSNSTGDLCEDTTLTPRNWACQARLLATGQYVDQSTSYFLE